MSKDRPPSSANCIDGLATISLLELIMVEVNIAAQVRGGNLAPALSTFLVNDGAARGYRKARLDLLARAPSPGDTITLADAAAVLDWHAPAAIVELLHLLDQGTFVADLQNVDDGDRTIVLRRL